MGAPAPTPDSPLGRNGAEDQIADAELEPLKRAYYSLSDALPFSGKRSLLHLGATTLFLPGIADPFPGGTLPGFDTQSRSPLSTPRRTGLGQGPGKPEYPNLGRAGAAKPCLKYRRSISYNANHQKGYFPPTLSLSAQTRQG
jgi:hypothetical protein